MKAQSSASIAMADGAPVELSVSSKGKNARRLVHARRGPDSYRDSINTDSALSRGRFVKTLAAKIGVEPDVLGPLIDAKLSELADQADERSASSDDDNDDAHESQATVAANMAAVWDPWKTSDGDAYVTIPLDGHHETWPVKSTMFKRFLAKQFFDSQGKAIGSEALTSAINLIEATALFKGEEREVHVRVAEHNGNIYLDLCNPQWQVVEITSSDWEVIDDSPVRFRRSRAMRPLPIPIRGGSVNQLRRFLNVVENTWVLVVAWLLASLHPRGPYPILALCAEQGSGKSTAARLIRSMIDPNAAPLRSEHRSPRDLMIAARNAWSVVYDNLSHIPQWLSDALCRLSTGGGFTTRELYTDLDEVIFDSQRPVLLTSIEEVATRSDLLDRCLIVSLPTIPDSKCRAEEDIYDEFEKIYPSILGALLDVLSGILRDLPQTHLDTLPRMADFARRIAAAEKALGWDPGTFMAAYSTNRNQANELALESSIIYRPLLKLLESDGDWEGSASALLDVLAGRAQDQVKHQKQWPKNGRSMGGHLGRIAPNLRAVGWTVDYDRTAKRRTWTIRLPSTMAADSSESFDGRPDDTGEEGHSAEGDAGATETPFDDTYDANDTSIPLSGPDGNQRAGAWEEGYL